MTPDEQLDVLLFLHAQAVKREARVIAAGQPITTDHIRCAMALLMIQKPRLAREVVDYLGPIATAVDPVKFMREGK